VFAHNLRNATEQLLLAARKKGLRLAAAESCTGGLLCALITEVPGSSAVFDRGFITYSNAAKSELLHVPEALIARHGAVSAEVALAMAQGALQAAQADAAAAITGIAGPDGGTPEKPVGLVYVATARRNGEATVSQNHFTGSRSEIRLQSTAKAIAMLADCVAKELTEIA
jgi:nicotinamide-nucleotide amidase